MNTTQIVHKNNAWPANTCFGPHAQGNFDVNVGHRSKNNQKTPNKRINRLTLIKIYVKIGTTSTKRSDRHITASN